VVLNTEFLRRSIIPLMLGQLGLALLQGLQFLLVARELGPHEFGKVASILAVTAALLPFSGFGLANMMVMHLARGSKETALLFGNCLAAGLVGGMLLAFIVGLVAVAISGDTSILLVCVIFGVSELIVTKSVDFCQHLFLGLERHAIASRLLLVQSAFRFLMAGALALLITSPTAMDWALLHLLGGSLAAILVLGYTLRISGTPYVDLSRIFQDVKTGLFFSVGLSSRSVYMDADKAVLGSLASLSVNGAYTAAFRLVFMATTPLTASLLALQAKMFRAGGSVGLEKTVQIAKRAIIVGMAYGMFVGGVLYFGAPLLPYVLGSKYELSVEMLQALAFLPVPLFIQCALSDALTAANFQRARSIVQILVAGMSVALNIVLIQEMSWMGAVIASYVSQIALVFLMAILVFMKIRQSNS
jgi:O-antigen/teichoic acid export membrane protein